MEKEQVRPLTTATGRLDSTGEASNPNKIGREKCIKCCGCITALLLIELIVIVILIFVVFKVKGPVIKMNGVKVDKLDLINGTTIPRAGTNISLTADKSVKSPNFALYKFRNTTASLNYRGVVIGEVRGLPGRAKARRTMKMNVTVDIIVDRLMGNPNLGGDVNSGLLNLTSYTIVPGSVKMLKFITKHVTVKMNCSFAINITSRAIQELKCNRKVKL